MEVINRRLSDRCSERHDVPLLSAVPVGDDVPHPDDPVQAGHTRRRLRGITAQPPKRLAEDLEQPFDRRADKDIVVEAAPGPALGDGPDMLRCLCRVPKVRAGLRLRRRPALP